MPVVDGTGIGQVRLGVLADIVGRDGVGREPVAVRWMEDSPHQPRPHRLMWLSLMQRLVTESSSRKVPFVMSTGILTTFPRREEQDMFPCQPQKGG